MAKKTIPYIGEFVNPYDYPATLKMARITFGPAATNDVVVTTAATYPLFNVPAGAVVLGVICKVVTAFTASVTLTIGDAASAAGYLASADIAPQAAGTVSNSLGGGEAYAVGKVYTAATDISVVAAAATSAVGQAEVFLLYALAGGD